MSKTIEAFPALIEFVVDKLSMGRGTNGKAGARLGLSSVQTSQCLKSPTGKKSWWRVRYDRLWKIAYEKGLADGKKQMTERVLDAVGAIYGTRSNAELAKAFGATNPAITHWQQGNAFPTAKSLQKLLKKRATLRIQKLAELEPIEPVVKSRAWWIDRDMTRRGNWRRLLEGKAGVYIFYDSIGNATYVGKTNSSTNDLFKEIEQRLRDATLRGVYYGKGIVKFKGKKKLRQGNVTRLISVYQMHDAESIHNIEALLIRAFMNNLMNLRVERFKP